jgi:hypothetical protein
LRVSFEVYIKFNSEDEGLAGLKFVAENIARVFREYLRYYKWPLFMTRNQNYVSQKVYVGIAE